MSDAELAQITANFNAALAKLDVATVAYEEGRTRLEQAKAAFRKWRASFHRERQKPPDGGGT